MQQFQLFFLPLVTDHYYYVHSQKNNDNSYKIERSFWRIHERIILTRWHKSFVREYLPEFLFFPFSLFACQMSVHRNQKKKKNPSNVLVIQNIANVSSLTHHFLRLFRSSFFWFCFVIVWTASTHNYAVKISIVRCCACTIRISVKIVWLSHRIYVSVPWRTIILIAAKDKYKYARNDSLNTAPQPILICKIQ